MRQTTREKKAHDSNRKIDSVDHINGIEILEDWKRRFRCTGGGGGGLNIILTIQMHAIRRSQ